MDRSKTIAVITTNLTNGFSSQILWGIQSESLETDYDLLMYTPKSALHKGGLEFLVEKITSEKKVSAVIIIAYPFDDRMADMFDKAGIKAVLIDSFHTGTSSILSDNYKGAFEAGSYMAKSGRRKIGVIAGDVCQVESQKLRVDGFAAALKEQGQDLDNYHVYKIDHYNYQAGRDAFRFMIMNDVDSVFCAAGDYVAQGFMNEAGRQGVHIPYTMSIIGFDDIEASADTELTTVRQPLDEMGREAFKAAVTLIKDPDRGPVNKVFDCTFVKRNSA
jgi:LacI family transcriptional regulator